MRPKRLKVTYSAPKSIGFKALRFCTSGSVVFSIDRSSLRRRIEVWRVEGLGVGIRGSNYTLNYQTLLFCRFLL